MASSTATPPSSLSLLLGNHSRKQGRHTTIHGINRARKASRHGWIRMQATQDSSGRQKAPPGVDTRIHWESEDEGWIGGSNSSSKQETVKEEEELLGEKFSELLNSSSDSYYQ